MIKSDFTNSILNLSATLADFIGVKNKTPKLIDLETQLKTPPKNVVFIIFDGLGVFNINSLTKNNNFYKKHIIKTLSSTIPATTTNATTTLFTASYPDEHLWLAWSLWLKEQNKVSAIYLNKNYYSHEPTTPYIGGRNKNITDLAKTSRNVSAIMPNYVNNFKQTEVIEANTVNALFNALSRKLKNADEKFIYCYCDEPDSTMHKFGSDSVEASKKFEEIQTELEKLLNTNKDLLVITTADHGHINISEYIEIYKDKEIMDLLERPLSMENRFTSFKVKKGKEKEFEKLYNKKYGKDLDLYKSDDLIKLHIFGEGKSNKKVKELIGNYIAVGNNTRKAFAFCDENRYVSNHAGFTKEEMEVPLCIFKSK